MSKALKDQGVTKKPRKTLTQLQKGEKITSSSAEDQYNALDKYAKNLNKLARDGKLDPIIGRDEEIRRLADYFSSNQK